MQPIEAQITLSGVRSADKRDGGKIYTADFYLPNAGPFEHNLNPDEYVIFATLPASTPITVTLQLVTRDETIPYGAGKSFKKKGLAVRVLSLVPVQARKAS